MKEQIKTPEKELSKEERQPMSCRVKTLVIRMVTKLTELARKMKEEMKATKSEIKQNIQGTNVKVRKLGLILMI